MLPTLLNLPGIDAISIDETEHDYHIKAAPTIGAAACPHCHHKDLYAFGRREQFVRDLPMHGKRVGLYLDTQRYRCKACKPDGPRLFVRSIAGQGTVHHPPRP